MSADLSLGTPNWEELGVPVVDDAEPEDAGDDNIVSRLLANPNFLARLLADARHDGVVEVDNPLRREFRPRRGTEE